MNLDKNLQCHFLKENICLYIRSVFLLRREAINTSVLIEFSMIQFLTAYLAQHLAEMYLLVASSVLSADI